EPGGRPWGVVRSCCTGPTSLTCSISRVSWAPAIATRASAAVAAARFRPWRAVSIVILSAGECERPANTSETRPNSDTRSTIRKPVGTAGHRPAAVSMPPPVPSICRQTFRERLARDGLLLEQQRKGARTLDGYGPLGQLPAVKQP